MLFFGCWEQSGHYLWDRDRRYLAPRETSCPLKSSEIVGVFAPRGGEDERRLQLTHVHGWTVLAMWDRSIDTRPGSNAAFLESGTLTVDQMIATAERQFPTIAARLKAFAAYRQETHAHP